MSSDGIISGTPTAMCTAGKIKVKLTCGRETVDNIEIAYETVEKGATDIVFTADVPYMNVGTSKVLSTASKTVTAYALKRRRHLA